MMDIKYRPARKGDCRRLGELDSIASGGVVDFMFRDLVPGLKPAQVVATGLEADNYPHTYRSAVVAEYRREVVALALSFPSELFRITAEMRNFIPADRLDHLHELFAARVSDSWFLDALCVIESLRGQGIGTRLIERTKELARERDYNAMSLLVFKDNIAAIGLYERLGFTTARSVPVARHERIPHDGGCVLMRCDLG